MKYAGLLALGLLSSNLVFAQAQNAINEAWKGFSDPEIMSSGFIHNLESLPLSGAADSGTKAWSGHYWPSKKAGIANRWNSPRKETFDYSSPARSDIFRMGLEQLAILSPAEKMDLLNGRYDFPFKEEATKNSNRFASDWAGICHGWAPASVHHNEPTPEVMTNADGLRIPFGSADIKALLSYHYAFYDDNSSRQMGLRCFFGRWMGGARGCDEDLNAGAFHIVITNMLGLRREAFMMDKERWREVWNQPVLGFNSSVVQHYSRPSEKAAKDAVREVRVVTELFYVNESDPNWNVVHGTDQQIVDKMDLQYRLELNAAGNIVGGEWESSERPDFLWYKPKNTRFRGPLLKLSELLDD